MLRESKNENKSSSDRGRMLRAKDSVGRRAGSWLCLSVIAMFVAQGALLSAGDDETEKATLEKQSKRRLELMQAAIAEMEGSSSQIHNAAALKLGKSPSLRYNDPTRQLRDTKGLLDAGVWRMGEDGRPTALVTLEIYRVDGKSAQLCYEFVSLTPSRFSLVSPRGPQWTPTGTELKMVRLEDAPRPGESRTARLIQMRQICRRFTVRETLGNGDQVECRLLTQPIDRYADDAAGISDGAIFVFANGTNPELAVILECNAEQWTHGAARLSSALLFAELDGKKYFEAPQRFDQPPSAPYRGTCESVTLED